MPCCLLPGRCPRQLMQPDNFNIAGTPSFTACYDFGGRTITALSTLRTQARWVSLEHLLSAAGLLPSPAHAAKPSPPWTGHLAGWLLQWLDQSPELQRGAQLAGLHEPFEAVRNGTFKRACFVAMFWHCCETGIRRCCAFRFGTRSERSTKCTQRATQLSY